MLFERYNDSVTLSQSSRRNALSQWLRRLSLGDFEALYGHVSSLAERFKGVADEIYELLDNRYPVDPNPDFPRRRSIAESWMWWIEGIRGPLMSYLQIEYER